MQNRNSSTTAELAKKLNPSEPTTVVQSKPAYDLPPHCPRQAKPNDPPTPPGYVRRQYGITGDYYFYQTEEEYYDHLLLNYS